MVGDILTSLVILGSCFLCMTLIMASGQLQNIQKNWGEYRCIPVVMPFAGYLGPVPPPNAPQGAHHGLDK